MSFIKTFLVVFLVLATSVASAQVYEEWVARYHGPVNWSNLAKALAVDGSGNVYVTGTSWDTATNHDYATVKYDRNGNELWAARYIGIGVYGDDVANALAVDDAGNVYVTGYSYFSGYVNFDYATVKYDPDGNEVWVARYQGPVNDVDKAYALAVDGSSNVYVTGQSDGSDWEPDYTTIKYDSNGNELWVARYDGPYYRIGDMAYAITLDAAGNVYVTGQSYNAGSAFDYATVKYDPNGSELWVARYNGPEDHSDEAYALAVDAAGNVYVTGSTLGSSGWQDYATVKYDPNGVELWVALYNGPADDRDEACALGLDAQANVYVTGYSEGSGTSNDYATVKYDPNGNELWVARYNGPANDNDWANALAVDGSGNVYVTGYSRAPFIFGDYATVKYDPDGNEEWVARYDGANGIDEANALAVDGSGNVYVTGYSKDWDGSIDYTTIKYSQQPALEMSCEALSPVLCRGKNFYFKLTVTNNTGGNISGDLTFSGYSGYDCDPGSILVSIPRDRTYLPGVTEAYYLFKVPTAASPGQYSASVGGTLGGYDLFCCMNVDIIQCEPWKEGTNTEWELVEADRPEVVLPTMTELYSNSPNPFNATTQFSYSLAEAGTVKLTIHNLRGQLVETVVDGHQEAGEHHVIWDASDYSSGVYFYKLQAGDFVSTKKMNLLK
ncbi:MAG: SBBP repeat-containing protein [Candidatus Zixiibacteriota bacterium]